MRIRWVRPRFRLRTMAGLVAAAALACWAVLHILSPTGRRAALLRPDQPAYVRREAAGSLGRGVPPWEAGRALGLAVAALDDPSPRVRESATISLWEIGPAAAPAVPRVVAHLDDPDRGVRFAMARSLGKLAAANSPRRAEVVEALARKLADADPLVRLAAAESLVEMGEYGWALATLLDLRDGPDAPANTWAAQFLQRGRSFDLIADDLARDIQSRDAARRAQALRALIRIAPPGITRRALALAMRADDPEVARWAATEDTRIARKPGP